MNFPSLSTVMLLDKHTDGPYLELIQKAYAPNHPVIRHQHYQGKKVENSFYYNREPTC